MERDLLPGGGNIPKNYKKRLRWYLWEERLINTVCVCACACVCVWCVGGWACVCVWWVVHVCVCVCAAYTEDVVRVIQRSRCLVCLLSAEFLSNSSAVFVLEAGVQVENQKWSKLQSQRASQGVTPHHLKPSMEWQNIFKSDLIEDNTTLDWSVVFSSICFAPIDHFN